MLLGRIGGLKYIHLIQSGISYKISNAHGWMGRLGSSPQGAGRAGHDTTANTLAFAMLLLTTHPDVQLWLAGEIAAVQTTLKGDDVLLEGWG